MLPDTSPADRAPDQVTAVPTGRPGPPSAGIAELPDHEDALAELYAWPDSAGSPMVRANMITSLDGGATVDGRSAGLGNRPDERLFAVLRDLAEVILVGSGTVRAEKYGGIRLDGDRQARRRRWGLPGHPPPIAVVTARGLDPRLPLFTDTEIPPIVITTQEAADRVPAGLTVITAGTDRVDLTVAIAALGTAGFRRIHCEGGPSLLGSLAAADLVDECCLTIAPMMLGARAQPLFPVTIDDPVRWALVAARVVGNHLFTRYRRDRR